MSRLAAAFARAEFERRKAFIAYVCGGDPSMEATQRLIPELVEAAWQRIQALPVEA